MLFCQWEDWIKHQNLKTFANGKCSRTEKTQFVGGINIRGWIVSSIKIAAHLSFHLVIWENYRSTNLPRWFKFSWSKANQNRLATFNDPPPPPPPPNNHLEYTLPYSPAYRRRLFSFFKCKYWVDKPYYPYITMRYVTIRPWKPAWQSFISTQLHRGSAVCQPNIYVWRMKVGAYMRVNRLFFSRFFSNLWKTTRTNHVTKNKS